MYGYKCKNIMKELGFIEDVNYISCSINNFDEKIKYITNKDNIENINFIRKNGYELIKKIILGYNEWNFYKYN